MFSDDTSCDISVNGNINVDDNDNSYDSNIDDNSNNEDKMYNNVNGYNLNNNYGNDHMIMIIGMMIIILKNLNFLILKSSVSKTCVEDMSYINRQDFRVLFLQEIMQYLWSAVNNLSCGGIANYLN